jgi:hypothetical protein
MLNSGTSRLGLHWQHRLKANLTLLIKILKCSKVWVTYCLYYSARLQEVLFYAFSKLKRQTTFNHSGNLRRDPKRLSLVTTTGMTAKGLWSVKRKQSQADPSASQSFKHWFHLKCQLLLGIWNRVVISLQKILISCSWMTEGSGWKTRRRSEWEDPVFKMTRLQDVWRTGIRSPHIDTEWSVKRVRLSIVFGTSRIQILARRRTAHYFISISSYIPRQHIKLGHDRFLLYLFQLIQELSYI